VRAIPALIDSMAVAYNRKLFKAAGVAPPADGWTWDDFRATAKKLTDSGKGVYGTGWPGVGDEDTVWRLWPMVWQLGGDVLSKDGKELGFTNASGEQSLELIRAMSRDDKSIYVDTKPGSEQMYQVFGSNRMGMIPTGPWQLPTFVDQKVDYGVAPMPAFKGEPTTISGPDAWVLFDNGDARAKAAQTFVQWLTAPKQDAQWDIEAGSLPLRESTAAQPLWKKHVAEVEGLQTFVDALGQARVRPATPDYPKISQATGEAIVSVLLGKADVQQALDGAAKRVDAELAAP
jgi:multiple sugar transport system substrate-binding protein